eukprot:scaffold255358_cov21-Tisochrysis_lutea.AAC.1
MAQHACLAAQTAALGAHEDGNFSSLVLPMHLLLEEPCSNTEAFLDAHSSLADIFTQALGAGDRGLHGHPAKELHKLCELSGRQCRRQDKCVRHDPSLMCVSSQKELRCVAWLQCATLLLHYSCSPEEAILWHCQRGMNFPNQVECTDTKSNLECMIASAAKMLAISDCVTITSCNPMFELNFSPLCLHLRVCDLDAQEHRPTLRGHTSMVTSIAISADGTMCVSGSKDQSIRLWNLKAGTSSDLEGHACCVDSVAINSCGTICISGGSCDEVV